MSKKSLNKNINNHEFPKIMLKYPTSIRLVHIIENFTRLKNWHINKTLRDIFKMFGHEVTFLDIGCGSGVFSIPYALKFSNSNIVCADKNSNNLEFINRYIQISKPKNIDTQEFNLGTTISSKKYNLILCASVLQYVQNDIKALSDLKSQLSNNGLLLLYLPINENRVFPFFNYLYKNYFKNFNYNISNNLIHKYTAEGVIQILKEAGFKIKKTKQTYGCFGKVYFELNTILELSLKRIPIYLTPIIILILILAFPLFIVFMIIDYLVPTKKGNGFLVVAEAE